MEADETGTIARLGGHPHQLTDPAIARHHGRIVKLMGDGALVAFDSLDLKDVFGLIQADRANLHGGWLPWLVVL